METNEQLAEHGLPAICSAIAIQNALVFTRGSRRSLRQIANAIGYSREHEMSDGSRIAGTKGDETEKYIERVFPGTKAEHGGSAARHFMVRQPCIVSFFYVRDYKDLADPRGHVFFSAPADSEGTRLLVMNFGGNYLWETDDLFRAIGLQGELPGESRLVYIRVFPL